MNQVVVLILIMPIICGERQNTKNWLVIGFGVSAVQHCCDHIWLACIVRVVKISLVPLYLGNRYDLALALAAMKLGLV